MYISIINSQLNAVNRHVNGSHMKEVLPKRLIAPAYYTDYAQQFGRNLFAHDCLYHQTLQAGVIRTGIGCELNSCEAMYRPMCQELWDSCVAEIWFLSESLTPATLLDVAFS